MPVPQLPYKRPFFTITLNPHEIEVRSACGPRGGPGACPECLAHPGWPHASAGGPGAHHNQHEARGEGPAAADAAPRAAQRPRHGPRRPVNGTLAGSAPPPPRPRQRSLACGVLPAGVDGARGTPAAVADGRQEGTRRARAAAPRRRRCCRTRACRSGAAVAARAGPLQLMRRPRAHRRRLRRGPAVQGRGPAARGAWRVARRRERYQNDLASSGPRGAQAALTPRPAGNLLTAATTTPDLTSYKHSR